MKNINNKILEHIKLNDKPFLVVEKNTLKNDLYYNVYENVKLSSRLSFGSLVSFSLFFDEIVEIFNSINNPLV